jgi:uncharacterized protein (TIGR03437 family)
MKWFFAPLAGAALFPALFAQTDVVTANYDLNRTNANLHETLLTPSNVNPRQFGKVFSFAVDGQVYAQPLYLHGVQFGSGALHNVVFVATMHNSVYAFDADGGNGLAPLWQVNFGPSVNPLDFSDSGGPYADIQNEIGILGTPVIDPATGTLYAVHFTGSNGSYAYWLHALDVTTGEEKFGGPVKIEGSVEGSGWGGEETPDGGRLAFVAGEHLQRPGLLLLNGVVYVAFGSHGDIAPWHGWLMGYNAGDLRQVSVFNTTPNDAAGALWQGGRGLASDGENIFVATGNGTYDAARTAWSQSVLKLATGGGLSVADWFTPSEWDTLNGNDIDVGSSGPVLIPGTDLAYQAGKEGELFLLDRSAMGEEVESNSQVAQSFPLVDASFGTSYQESNGFFVFNSALWDMGGGKATVYFWPLNQSLRAYRFGGGQFETAPGAENTTATNALPFSGFSVSANGATADTAILWATSAGAASLPAPGTIHAFDASNISTELWNSDESGARDTMGGFTKFANPTVANGRVYVPTSSNRVDVYGLLAGVAGIATVVNAASFEGGGVAGGEIVTVFGNGLGPSAPVVAAPGASGFPTELGGVRVKFNGQAAALLFVSATQINAVVPFGLTGGEATMTVAAPGADYTARVAVNATSAALFTQNASGAGPGAILNAPDDSLNSPSNPAARGGMVALYLTGAGPYTPAMGDGELCPMGNPPALELPVSVTIGGLPAKVTYQGGAPGLVAGLAQVNVEVPADVTPGPAVPVSVVVGTTPAENVVTMAVK